MDLTEYLGVDPDDATWRDLAACRGMPLEWFFDDYESDKQVAKQVDEICQTCPVQKVCYEYGRNTGSQGVWGGIYLNDSGKIDYRRNEHKTKEVWSNLK